MKFTTDGSLYVELENNPILKKTVSDNGEYSYTGKNLYDIVIVDEAHEHNKNMDMILTMMKYALYYNNNIKLVIISATMDQDEPIYRRYYRDINDNRMYPFNQFVVENELDRINIDRRLHISPPGETTRFIITDKYAPEESSNPDDLVLKIINTTISGDVLYFQPGVADINKSIEYLNAKTPPNTIAVPFYGVMTDEKRNFIQGIAKKKYDLDIPKSVNFGSDYDEGKIKKVPKGTYTRIIIVATNIAEASITVASLRYVVETGTQKIMEYNYKLRDETLIKTSISESSRLQRRGRVGRVAEGTVYYLYPEGDKEDVKTPFEVSIQDISTDIFRLLRNTPNEKEMFAMILDPNRKGYDYNKDDLEQLYIKNLSKMVSSQYFYDNTFISYYGNDDHYDYNNSERPNPYYETGYSMSTLLDLNGRFYIVHPEERCINRNIVGVITSVVDISDCIIEFDNNVISSNKINSFVDILKERLFIFFDPNSHKYYKTEYGIKLRKLHENLVFDDIRNVITYLYSRVYETNTEIFSGLVLLEVLGDSVAKLFSQYEFKGKSFFNLEKGRDLYSSRYGDFHSVTHIATKIVKFIDNNVFKITDIYNKKLDKSKLNDFLLDKIDYLENYKTGNYQKVGYDMVNKLIQMDGRNKLSHKHDITEEEIEEIIKEDLFQGMVLSSIEKSDQILSQWCDRHYFNKVVVSKFVEKYIFYINKVYKILNKIEDIDYDIPEVDISLEWFDKRLPLVQEYKEKYKITMPFLHSYGFNIAINVIKTPFYLPIVDPSPENIKSISKMGKYLNTLIKDEYIGEYILFLGYGRMNSLYGINYVTPDMIQKAVPFIYSPSVYDPTKYKTDRNQEAIQKLLSGAEVGELNEKIVGYYLKTLGKIKIDMINSFDPKIYSSYNKLDDNPVFEKYLEHQRNRYLREKFHK